MGSWFSILEVSKVCWAGSGGEGAAGGVRELGENSFGCCRMQCDEVDLPVLKGSEQLSHWALLGNNWGRRTGHCTVSSPAVPDQCHVWFVRLRARRSRKPPQKHRA